MYCNFSSNPESEPIVIDDNSFIKSIDKQLGHKYLGMKFIPTDIVQQIRAQNRLDRAIFATSIKRGEIDNTHTDDTKSSQHPSF